RGETASIGADWWTGARGARRPGVSAGPCSRFSDGGLRSLHRLLAEAGDQVGDVGDLLLDVLLVFPEPLEEPHGVEPPDPLVAVRSPLAEQQEQGRLTEALDPGAHRPVSRTQAYTAAGAVAAPHRATCKAHMCLTIAAVESVPQHLTAAIVERSCGSRETRS